MSTKTVLTAIIAVLLVVILGRPALAQQERFSVWVYFDQYGAEASWQDPWHHSMSYYKVYVNGNFYSSTSESGINLESSNSLGCGRNRITVVALDNGNEYARGRTYLWRECQEQPRRPNT